MKTLLVTGFLLGVAALAACSSVRTQHDFDARTDFRSWRTYAWYPPGQARTGDFRLDSPLLHARIIEAVDRALAADGFTKLEEGDPDFYVNFHLSTEERLDVRTMNRVYWGGPHGRMWGGGAWGGVTMADTVVDQYEEGTLVIDFVDVANRRLAWRGSGTRRLSQNTRPDQVTRRVNEAVDEILRPFPPGA